MVPVTPPGDLGSTCDTSLEEMLMRYRPLVAIALALTLTATACGGSPTASQGGGGNENWPMLRSRSTTGSTV